MLRVPLMTLNNECNRKEAVHDGGVRNILEHTSSTGHNKSTATYGAIPSEKDLKTSRIALPQQRIKQSHRDVYGRQRPGLTKTPPTSATIRRDLTNTDLLPED